MQSIVSLYNVGTYPVKLQKSCQIPFNKDPVSAFQPCFVFVFIKLDAVF